MTNEHQNQNARVTVAQVPMAPAVIAKIDEFAAEKSISRAAWIRRLVVRSLRAAEAA